MNSVGVLDPSYIFTNRFDEESFVEFSINLVNLESSDLLSCMPIREYSKLYKAHIDYVKDIGRYKDEKNRTVLISIIKMKESPEKSRTMQRNFIAKHIKELDADAALVGLYCETSDVWRMSFVKLYYTFDIEGLTEIITPAKRYSYLIEPHLKNHTAQEQLGKLFYDDSQKPSLDMIEKVFSVQSVTDEFFKMYKEKYLDLKEILEKCTNFVDESNRLMIKIEDFSEEFAKKLMGQISFLYFLQKKGWLGVKIVPKIINFDELREFFIKQDEDTRCIINKVYKSEKAIMRLSSKDLNKLTNEEAETLASIFRNTKYDMEWGSGTKSFIRTIYNTAERNNLNFFNEYLEPLFYNALNQRRGSTEYYQLFNCKIPFLNGGLFEPIYRYKWKEINIKIPNTFFSNEEENGLLDLFDMYNFTINEDEPLEKEIAVDPEMLGKIFENLLEIKERKSKGAYYTPREIVHYMCQECLINYLTRKTHIDEKFIEIFIKYGEIIKDADFNVNNCNKNQYSMPEVILANMDSIDRALGVVTVADPAVGSGAFPLGMLSEIVKARNVITEYMSKDLVGWKKQQLIDSRSMYKFKKDTMKKSIFAVDIEPSAVDIAKLRLWLSLIVDAEVKTVNTLPNLDYNIMVGNSLIDEYEGIKLFDEDLLKSKPKRKRKTISNQIKMSINNSGVDIGVEQEQEILEDIQNLQLELFDIKITSEKIKIKEDIEKKEWELIEYKLLKDNKYNLLKKFYKIKHENRKPYFLWKLEFSRIFRDNGGFDIVIGNPPYGACLDTVQKNILSKKHRNVPDFETSDYFICESYEILTKGGINSFIIPNTILSNLFAKKMRKELLTKWSICEIDNLSNVDIFSSATVRNCIPFLIKQKRNDTAVKLVDYKENQGDIIRIMNVEDKDTLDNNIDSWLNLFYQDNYSKNIVKIIREKSIKLGDLAQISQGLIAYDKYRGHSKETIKNRVWHNSYKVDETYKKELQGRDVTRYKVCWNEKKWISYGEWLAAPRKKEFFNEERILIREITNPNIMACYTDKEFYNTPSIINVINFKDVSPYYILAILNSSLMSYYHNKTSPKANKGAFPKILVNDVRNIPIKICDSITENKLVTLVKQIIEEENLLKQNEISKEIDKLIYCIYGIDEINQDIINNFFI